MSTTHAEVMRKLKIAFEAMRHNPPYMSGRPPSIVDFYDPKINGMDAHGRTRDMMIDWDDDRLERQHDYIQMMFPLPEGSMFAYNAPVIDKQIMETFRLNTTLQMSLFNCFLRMLGFYGFCGEVKKSATDPYLQSSDMGKGKRKALELYGQPADQVEDRKDSATASTGDTGNSPADMKPPVVALEDTEVIELPPEAVNLLTDLRIIRDVTFEERSKNWCVRMDHNHLRISRILRCLRVLGLQTVADEFYKALKEVYNDPNINIGERSMMFWRRAAREPLHIAPDGTECKWLRNWKDKADD